MSPASTAGWSRAEASVDKEPSKRDCWADWLLHRRQGGKEVPPRLLDELRQAREGVLRNARLKPGDVLLDVGAGDGLIAFGALEQVGESGRVVFSDISQDLLDHSRRVAEEMGVANRCEFLWASADNLTPVRDAWVDAVTTRSVLIYVSRKQEAFREFSRVLKPDGRISLFEPINRFGYPPPKGSRFGYDLTAVEDLEEKIWNVFRSYEPAQAPMIDFDERDLIALAEGAGFREIQLELSIKIQRRPALAWEQFLDSSWNPLVPTFREAMDRALTPHEVSRLTAHMRPAVEAGVGRLRHAFAYLWASKN